MPPSSHPPPPPPRPDPVTLDLIFERLTSADVPMEERAYHLVALSTVAFHPTVKLFLFEHTPINACSIPSQTPNPKQTEAEAENGRRREALLKSVAFFLAQRSQPVAKECRWETVALLGEMCRMEAPPVSPPHPAGRTPQGDVAQKINVYARRNLEYVALLPWFVPAAQELIGEETAKHKAQTETSSSSLITRRAARPRREESARRGDYHNNYNNDNEDGSGNGVVEMDEDVRIALRDILAALPTVGRADNDNDNNNRTDAHSAPFTQWTESQLEHAQDLMFLDASTTMLHLIPLVAQSSHVQCANCERRGSGHQPFLRCGSCKAVYYCGADCQRAHWTTAHKVPCQTYKQCCADIHAQYAAMNSAGGKRHGKKKNGAAVESMAVLEVPLEPSLFYPTRRYLYDHRDGSFADVPFDDYFMKYTVRGN